MTPYPSREEILAASARKKRKYWLWFFAIIGLIIFINIQLSTGVETSSNTSSYQSTSPSVVADRATLRKQAIDEQFSAWDGSHRNLERLIKSSMHDADSYEHVKTEYWDHGEILVVNMTYRGNNAFGAKILTSTKAEVSLNGDVIKVFE